MIRPERTHPPAHRPSSRRPFAGRWLGVPAAVWAAVLLAVVLAWLAQVLAMRQGLAEQAGLRNQRIGAAMVSPLHANYLINTGGASAGDVVRLARLVKERVRAVTGVLLQEEVSCLGFPPAEPAI